ncbi:MAG: hypothetical protein M1565_04140, partial [Actinobacteria bacterium]|nr:hypothetical protein [Actinomycetota bacterium]
QRRLEVPLVTHLVAAQLSQRGHRKEVLNVLGVSVVLVVQGNSAKTQMIDGPVAENQQVQGASCDKSPLASP